MTLTPAGLGNLAGKAENLMRTERPNDSEAAALTADGWLEYLLELGNDSDLGARADSPDGEKTVIFRTQNGWVRVKVESCYDAELNLKVTH